MELCRACLSTNKPMIRIGETFIMNYNLLTNLNITTDDGLPQSSCYTCLDTVNRFIEFREKCANAESLLKQASCLEIKAEDTLDQITYNEVQDPIKDEIKHENEVDETVYNNETITDDDFKTIYDLDEAVVTETEVTSEKKNKRKYKGGAKYSKIKEKKTIKLNLEKIAEEKEVLLEKDISVTEQKKKRGRPKKISSLTETKQRKTLDLKLYKTITKKVRAENFKCGIETKKKLVRSKGSKKTLRKTQRKIFDLELGETVKKVQTLHALDNDVVMPHKGVEKEAKLSENFVCGLCSKKYKEKIDRDLHLESHKSNRYCKQCSESFDSWSQQLAHRLKHVPPNQNHCHICLKRHRTCDYLEFHYRNEHFQEEGLSVKCKMCLSSYDNPTKLRKHKWSSHSEKNISCGYCSKLFNSKSSLRAHIVRHMDEKAYRCDLCDYKTRFQSGLKEHTIRKHTATKVCCKVCSRVFANQMDMDKHKCSQNNVVCPICGLQFAVRHKLTRHMRCHTNLAKYECRRCPKKFKSIVALRTHEDRHDGNRRRQCEYCPAKFYGHSSLIKHRRIHTGEKPYACKVCGKAFTGNYNLKLHMKVHGEHGLIKKKLQDTEGMDFF